MKVDMHVHTWFSRDCISGPDQIVTWMKKRGLDAIAVVDHRTSLGHASFGGDIAIKGIEMDTTNGHLVGLFLEDDIVQKEKTIDVGVASDMIRDAGGIVVVPHPFDLNRSFHQIEKWRDAGALDCIEVCNSFCKGKHYNELANDFANRNKLGRTAGSDAHLPRQVGSAYIEAEASDFEELRKYVMRGKVRVFCKTLSMFEIGFTSFISGIQSFTSLFGGP